MSNKNPTLTKESFGWTEIENDTFFKIYGDSLPNGSFQLSKRGNNYYWFYKLSTRDKGNLKYLCKTFEGKKDGLWKQYYENGQLCAKGNYHEGIPVGFWETWRQNGKLWSEFNYKDGVIVDAKCWDSKGNEQECPSK